MGTRLVPLLVEAGHDVAGLTRSPNKTGLLEGLGAEPVVGDVFDRDGLVEAVVAFGAEMVMHQLTDLPDEASRIGDFAAANARIRREGTANLLEAARRGGTPRFLAQSVAWNLPGDGAKAVADMEASVLEYGGTILRYGQFYGEGTYHPSVLPEPPRIHVDEAARRTVAMLEAEPGTHEIVDG